MVILAAVFSIFIVSISVFLSYRWVISPHNEVVRQQAYEAVERTHRQNRNRRRRGKEKMTNAER